MVFLNVSVKARSDGGQRWPVVLPLCACGYLARLVHQRFRAREVYVRLPLLFPLLSLFFTSLSSFYTDLFPCNIFVSVNILDPLPHYFLLDHVVTFPVSPVLCCAALYTLLCFCGNTL